MGEIAHTIMPEIFVLLQAPLPGLGDDKPVWATKWSSLSSQGLDDVATATKSKK